MWNDKKRQQKDKYAWYALFFLSRPVVHNIFVAVVMVGDVIGRIKTTKHKFEVEHFHFDIDFI